MILQCIDDTSSVTRLHLPQFYISRLEAHLVTGRDVVHHEPAPLPVPGDAVDAVDHLVHVMHPKLCEQLGRHLVYLNQVLIIIINMT